MNWRRLLKICAGLSLSGSLLYFGIATLRWPLVNDAALMHFVVFLMDHGMAPYRQIHDVNLPGSYLVEWTVMHTLGAGSLAWRTFDFLLLAVAGAAMVSIARPYGWFGGFFGAALFGLYHGRDGAGQLGQRDLTMAVLLLAACAFAFEAVRAGRRWPMALFGLVAGIAVAIKPTAGLVLLFLLFATLAVEQSRRGPIWKYGLAAALGICLPFAAMLGFLMREHALAAFLQTVTGELPYHAGVGDRGLPYLLRWSMTSSIATLLLLAFVIAISRHDWRRWETTALLGCAGLGWASFLLQRKGYPYHRYPMLAFLLLWVGIQLTEALSESLFLRSIGVAGLLYGALALGPIYAIRARKSHWNEAMLVSLE